MMEQKGMLISACVGVGVGVGLGLASGQTKWGPNSVSSNTITPEKIEHEMLRLIVDGRESNVTFDNFPYYLSEQTRVLLTSAAYVHLKHAEVSKYTRNLAPASRTILLSGPAELYQQVLAKALAHYFEAKLLLFDVTDFSLKIQSRYGSSNIENSLKRSTSETTLARLSDLFGSIPFFPQREDNKGKFRRQSSGVDLRRMETEGSSNPPKLRRNASASGNMSSLGLQSNPTNSAPGKHIVSWSFDEKLLIQTIYKVLVYVSKTYPIVLYLRDVDKLLGRSQRISKLFQTMLTKLSGQILILGSRVVDSGNDCKEVDDMLASLFPYDIEIKPPDDESHLVSWKAQFEQDMKKIQIQDNKNHIMEVLAANDLDCHDLDSICVEDAMVLSNSIEEVIVSAISYHLMTNKEPDYRNGKLVIPCNSLSHALGIFQEGKNSGRDTMKLEAQAITAEVCAACRDCDVHLVVNNIYQREEGAAVVKPEGKPEGSAPGIKTEAEIPASVAKTDGENSVPAPKAEVPDNEFEKRIRPENICTTAAYRPVRELIQQEIKKDTEKKKREAEGQNAQDAEEVEQERVITLRPLNMQDFKVAKSQVAASFASEGAGMNELKQWNDLYGEGGSRKKEQLSYFL
ncbi:hypothetical protein TSUD_227270 [Trifolium subterraneum]|uniref:DUF7751 domain-containing protein n=1 Tax=Trifolium subterraneum TaxID=3900 RepID=A0A2Z6MXB1_TRISU|nr:hypothetical protein TSUD_227270 [Trifolium subterraneum]